jgi:hypothetical protein
MGSGTDVARESADALLIGSDLLELIAALKTARRCRRIVNFYETVLMEVSGVIYLPIIGTDETFRWGVWGSLSKDNFEKLLEMDQDPKRSELQPMFSWLSTKIADYPDTLSLKMHTHVQPLPDRPRFELEPSDHPLSQEYHHGIRPERVREIMLRGLKAVQ